MHIVVSLNDPKHCVVLWSALASGMQLISINRFNLQCYHFKGVACFLICLNAFPVDISRTSLVFNVMTCKQFVFNLILNLHVKKRENNLDSNLRELSWFYDFLVTKGNQDIRECPGGKHNSIISLKLNTSMLC